MKKPKPSSDEISLARACHDVGVFMHCFALTEASLDAAVAAALGLDDLQKYIVSANVPFANKVHIARSALAVSYIDDKLQKHHQRHLNKLLSLNTDRVMVAHYLFGPNDDQTATDFLYTKAKSDLDITPITWEPKDFLRRYNSLSRIRAKLLDLEKAFKSAKMKKALVEALKGDQQPNQGFGALSLLGSPPPQAQG